jgi:hypothetical protein
MAVSAALALSAMQGCTTTAATTAETTAGTTMVRPRDASPARPDHHGSASAPARSGAHGTPSPPGMSSARAVQAASDERGLYIDVQPGQLGFDHSLQVRRSISGLPHELHDGDTVTAGDRIRVSVRTSVDAYLYLAFSTNRGITLYPSHTGIRARAGVPLSVPLEGAELVVDDKPGTEVLYVILSTTELSVADPRLAAALVTKQPDDAPQDCGPALDASLGGTPGTVPAGALPGPRTQIPRPGVIRERQVVKQPMTSSSTAHSKSSDRTIPRSPPHVPGPPGTVEPAPSAPPDPDFVRNPGNVMWSRTDDTRGPAITPRAWNPAQVTAADSTGIAVVRYVFTHVPVAR